MTPLGPPLALLRLIGCYLSPFPPIIKPVPLEAEWMFFPNFLRGPLKSSILENETILPLVCWARLWQGKKSSSEL